MPYLGYIYIYIYTYINIYIYIYTCISEMDVIKFRKTLELEWNML